MDNKQENRESGQPAIQPTSPLRQAWDQPAVYEIRVQGRLDARWADWVDGMDVHSEGEDGWAVTTLRGISPDQAALQGMLQKLYMLGLVLLEVRRAGGSSGDPLPPA